MTSFADAAATLRVVIPGFLALRWFYWRGLRTQRTDLELLLWSLVVSFPIYWLAAVIQPGDDAVTLLFAAAFAVLAGEGAARLWRWLETRYPALREYVMATAWDAVMAKPGGGWFQVRTTDGTTYQGWAQIVGDAGQTDALDLYLREPVYVDAAGQPIPIANAEGVLIAKSSIVSVVRFADPAPPRADG